MNTQQRIDRLEDAVANLGTILEAEGRWAGSDNPVVRTFGVESQRVRSGRGPGEVGEGLTRRTLLAGSVRRRGRGRVSTGATMDTGVTRRRGGSAAADR